MDPKEKLRLSASRSFSHLGILFRFTIARWSKNELKNSTMSRKLSTLRQFYKFLAMQGLVEGSPLSQIHSFKKRKESAGVFIQDEVASFFGI
ncbi:site-specific tyrosine recombinase XerC [gut metagenome]|uniref:Site-specific tyrosine recombinase XerC n=1 Tax=gut metagenome TaxID=749906 RepID=J9GDR2_9ZZZZ